MKYFLQRDGRTYGPYSFEDLKRYQVENRIGPNDSIRQEDSQTWEPWQQVLNPPAAAPAPAPTPAPMFSPPPQQPVYTPPPATPPSQGGFGAQGFGSTPAPSEPSWGGGAAAAGFGGAAASGFGQPSQPAPQQPAFGGFGQQPQQPQQGFGGFGQPAQPSGFGAPQSGYGGGGGVGPMPPDMQWYIVLLIGMVTCGLFTLYWLFKEVTFVQQIDPNSGAKKKFINAILLYVVGIVVSFSMGMIGAMMESSIIASLSMLGSLLTLGGAVFLILGMFEMRTSIHNYYTTVEPMGINLMDTAGAVLTFFFGVYFFQYHFANIAMRKKAMGHQ